jgi:signal peptidase I
MAARSSLADHYTVPTGSMEYTMMPGDRIVVDKLAYGLRIPFTDWKLTQGRPVTRGEVVIFDSPEDGVRLVKRIVAVPGDTVVIHNGQVLIGGHALIDPAHPDTEKFGERVASLNLRYGGGPDIEPTPVPSGYALAVGDARGNSRDGRYFGLIRVDAIYGRAMAVYYRSGEGMCWKKL